MIQLNQSFLHNNLEIFFLFMTETKVNTKLYVQAVILTNKFLFQPVPDRVHKDVTDIHL